MSTFINALLYGCIKGFADILDDDVKFSTRQSNKICCYDKRDAIEYYENIEGIAQNCMVKQNFVENNNNILVLRIDMIYKVPSQTRINYVTVANTGAGWKITDVYWF